MSDPFEPIVLARDGARADVLPFGAHVTSWTAHGRERLFMSERTERRPGVALRGGVPVIFPQFSTFGPLPRHGFARTRAWSVTHIADDRAQLVLHDDETTRAIWPHAFVATYDVSLDANSLTLTLTIDSRDDDAPMHFSSALHTYLRVHDVAAIRIDGLHGVRYLDQTASGTEHVESAESLGIDGEIDRIYQDVSSPLVVRDGAHALRLDAAGFADVVVWNPGAERAAGLADLEPEGWRHFVCVEAAAIRRPITLAPGERWRASQLLRVER